MTDLQQRRALVIGAANGFGRAIAARAAEAGLAVVAADLDLAGVRHWAAEIPTITSLKIDVTSPESVSSGVAQTVELLEGLDVLIYSPGVIFQRSLFEAPLEEWNTTLAVNLTGAFLASQAAAPALIESRAGRIVTVGSTAGLRGRPKLQAYSSSKFGLVGLTQSLALELAPHAVTANCICPASAPKTKMGQMITGWKSQEASSTNDEALAAVASTFPLGRYIEVDEVADAALYLLSEAARNITGSVIAIDGGKLLSL